jgi:hypothetical protein
MRSSKAVVDSQLAAEIMVHLVMRTRHLRDNLTLMIDQLGGRQLGPSMRVRLGLPKSGRITRLPDEVFDRLLRSMSIEELTRWLDDVLRAASLPAVTANEHVNALASTINEPTEQEPHRRALSESELDRTAANLVEKFKSKR